MHGSTPSSLPFQGTAPYSVALSFPKTCPQWCRGASLSVPVSSSLTCYNITTLLCNISCAPLYATAMRINPEHMREYNCERLSPWPWLLPAGMGVSSFFKHCSA